MVIVNCRPWPITLLLAFIIFLNCSNDDITDHNYPQPPDAPSNPTPAIDAAGIDTTVIFSWQCSDGNGDSLTYDFYLDTLSEPINMVDSNLAATTYQRVVEVSRDYYWKVVAKDNGGLETSSPVWHFSTVPGAEQIVFMSYRNGFSSIYSMNPDGSNVHIISDTLNANENWPSISNDGAKIVFAQGGDRIYTMNIDGTERFHVTNNANGAKLPVWSPDGSQIAFVVQGGNEVFYSSIWVVDADGENPHVVADYLMPNYEFEDISWSPHGEGFAFEYDSLGARSCAIYAINSDGTNMRQLTSHSDYSIDPAWSHDGTKIAFIRRLNQPELYQVFVMNSDGSDQHNVQNTQVFGYYPCWSPDDSQIAYTSYANNGDDSEIIVMNADGSNQRNISNNDYPDGGPSWGPYHR